MLPQALKERQTDRPAILSSLPIPEVFCLPPRNFASLLPFISITFIITPFTFFSMGTLNTFEWDREFLDTSTVESGKLDLEISV